jgi:hypothetical protein
MKSIFGLALTLALVGGCEKLSGSADLSVAGQYRPLDHQQI